MARFLIVEARFYDHLNDMLVAGARAALEAEGHEVEVLTGEIAEIPAEGTLLPETYLVTRGTSRQDVIDRMAAAQTALLDELWPARAENLPFDTREEAIILASVAWNLGSKQRVISCFPSIP